MNLRPLVKIGTIFLVTLLLLVPVIRIRELVSERQETRDAVIRDIARSAAYSQTITGPILVVPYLRKVRSWTEERPDEPRRMIEREVAGELLFSPADFELSGTLDVGERLRGIYRARIFDADTLLTGAFELEANYGLTADLADYTFHSPRLALGVSDIRGIGSGLELRYGGEAVPFEPGTGTAVLASGVHAPLAAGNVGAARRFDFSVRLPLQGTEDFQVTPIGRESRVVLTSNWPHPSFTGEFLPREREVTDQGFSARWQTSFFATNLENVLNGCGQSAPGSPACVELSNRHFGVSFIDPVDHYLKSDRAAKYAFLFIGLTFAAVFLFEVLRRFAVHPVQYGLVGLALAIFFLLLLSLSEHVGFALAYLGSSLACIALVGYYVRHVVKNGKLGAAFAGALGGLYALLYAILGAEDYALLIGSLLVFGVLGAIMVLTRNVDWARFGQAPEAARAAEPSA
jgi:inner membrane protein